MFWDLAGRFTARQEGFVVGSGVGFVAERSFQKEGEGGGDGVLLRLLSGEAESSDIVRGRVVVGRGDDMILLESVGQWDCFWKRY